MLAATSHFFHGMAWAWPNTEHRYFVMEAALLEHAKQPEAIAQLTCTYLTQGARVAKTSRREARPT